MEGLAPLPRRYGADALQIDSGLQYASPRERIRPNLDLISLRPRFRPALAMKHRPRAERRPQTLPLPAGVRIVDAAVHILAEETHRIRNVDVDELPVHQRKQRFAPVRLRDGSVRAKAERVV